ncbi:peptidase S8/S53 domain-containing protein [Suillus fuscotomentosus]|uniref:Peptidase S8/S53 domain-containing protein n=1 Tax=Suillus fuscotomentosus TaxID=1912939 RepID=A0AAD4HIJ8_9AGAM|nr:peptidase S8/S53 domain-containing protein [Suillus fuscotomentosus]KAG1898950.1 peptidase S8/S53 domain-containing protein [Suillus fuscotomentosus]
MSYRLATWSLLAAALAPAVLATPLSTNPYNIPSRPQLKVAPLIASDHPYGTVNNSYIVVLRDDLPQAVVQNHYNFLQMAHASDSLLGDGLAEGVRHFYDGHIKGYGGEFTENVIEQVRRMPEVSFVEKDQIVHTMDINTQKGSPWGLARISHRNKLGFSTFTKYLYDSEGGDGVDVYVVDTGINVAHSEFEGRASWGKTIPTNDVDEDGNGHGTHCAGTIASRKYGVAKKANVIAVKVLGSNGSGTMSDVVAGVAWAAQSAAKKFAAARAEFAATGKTKHKGSVANMSLGGGKSPSLDLAVNRAVDAGLHFAVAAGNDNKDACKYSPAAAENAVTVGASTLGDERAYFSNHGECVDIFAPGLNILSTYIGSRDAIATLSGTSMASPHTAGLLAYLLSIYPSATFDPSLSSMLPPALNLEHPYSSFYSLCHAALPRWMTGFMPSPQLFINAPIPGGPVLISPLELKTALRKLASSNMLTDLPPKTVNLLIFNNATA